MTPPPTTDPLPALPALLMQVRTVAHEAGQVILRFYNDRFDVSTKADGSPVTQADEAAEHVILPALRHILPGVPVVAEEECSAKGTPVVGDRFWLVDPLDGTREFVERNGEFTVNIALVDRGVPVLGVVYAPVGGDLFAGVASGNGSGEGGAVHCVDGKPDRPIAARLPPADGLTVVASRRAGDPELTERFLAGFPVRERVSCGSSLKFCTIAAGRADLYPRFGDTCEWDTAAGHAVLAAAGGRVLTPEGGALVYGKPGFRTPGFVAWGRAG